MLGKKQAQIDRLVVNLQAERAKNDELRAELNQAKSLLAGKLNEVRRLRAEVTRLTPTG